LEKGTFLRAEELDSEACPFFISFSPYLLTISFILQGRTRNLQHKAIALLCRGFYYETKGLASIFPEFFEDSVPIKAVALACVAVC
jgi:hypothetical protein